MPDALYPALHGRQHCPGGEDPIPCLGGEAAILYSWNYDTDNTVAQSTWTPVADFAGGGGFFEEAFSKGTNWTWDYDDGLITSGIAALYEVEGWVQFNESATNGEQRIVGVNFGSSDRYINEYTFKTTSSIEGGYKLFVRTHRLALSGLGTGPWLEVWHDSGSTRSIRDAQFLVRRLEVITFGELSSRP